MLTDNHQGLKIKFMNKRFKILSIVLPIIAFGGLINCDLNPINSDLKRNKVINAVSESMKN